MEELWKSKRKALRLAQRDNTNGNLKEAAKTASHEFKVAATKAKSDKYERFCVEVTEDRALIKFWNLYGAMTNKRKPGGLPDFKNEDEVWVRSDSEKGEALFKRFVKQTNQNNEKERTDFLNRVRMHFRDEPPDVSVTTENITSCIKSSSDSAPGPDSVKYSHMKGISEKDTTDITDLLNHSLEKGELPDDWLDSHLTPVPKPEKDPSRIASQCRTQSANF